MRKRNSSIWAILCAIALVCPTALFSQEARGTIVGRVMDKTGAVVPGAQVQVTNTAMGTTIPVTTNSAGRYQASFLIPGLYKVAVEFTGFKKFVREDIEVRVNDSLEINIELEVGSAEQSVTITGETALLSTTTASLGQVIDSRRVAELPIAHGNPFQLMGLAAGASFTRDMRLDRPFEPTHIVGYSIDGTRANRSDITLDGAPSTATANPGEITASYVPPADLVAEFKVQTATFDAAFGQTEGGVTNISTKAGTNSLHGTAYYTKMVPELFANDFFANANRIARPDFTYNRWGGTAGGPVLLPKLYDGRNKTFFMYGYEGISESRPRNNGTFTVPTAKMKTGDFSELRGNNFQIYNPFTRRSIGGGRYEQDPFPGNIIPQNLINPVARNIASFFPDPLQAGNAADLTNNYQRPELPEVIDYYTHSIRADHVINDKNRLFVRGSWYFRDSNYNNYFDNLTTGNWFQFISRSAVIDDVHMLTPTTILNVRYGYNRFIRVNEGNPEAAGFDLTSLGFPASYNNAIPADIRQFPRIDIQGYQGTAQPGEFRPNDTHSLNASVQKSAGAHFLKFGTEFRAYRENAVFYSNDQTGRFFFDSTWTRGPLDNSPSSPGQFGQSVAAFLLGLPSSTGTNISQVVRGSSYSEQSTSWGFFLQDDWKVNDKLTLNLGLRWEFEGALQERYNRTVRGFDPTAVHPFEAQAIARYAQNPTPEIPVSSFLPRGGITFAGVNGEPSGVYDPPMVNLMPRFGFAYKLTDKTVVRGGYGIYYGFLGQRRSDVIQNGFSRNTQVVPTLDNGLTFIGTLSDPYPNGILEPLGSALGAQTFLGQSISFFNEKPLMPYMQRWQLSLQRELGSGFVAEASYVGNRGTHVELSTLTTPGVNLNALSNQYLSTSPVRDNTRNAYLSAAVPNPFAGLLPGSNVLNGSTIARERLLRPFPQFDAVNASRFDGYSWYHSMQLNLEKRFAQGYTFNANYTWSKFMQATELLNAADPLPTEMISDLDRPHRFTASWIYELPFGRGRRFLANANPFASVLVSGWQLSGIYSYQSGAPIGFTTNLFFNGDINQVKLDDATPDQWFNTSGFVTNSAQQPVSNVRTFPLRFGFLRADAIDNWDLALIKNTRVAEGKDIQFRGEFLNALNHPLFPGPGINPTVAAFGKIQASTQANYSRRIQLSLKFLF